MGDGDSPEPGDVEREAELLESGTRLWQLRHSRRGFTKEGLCITAPSPSTSESRTRGGPFCWPQSTSLHCPLQSLQKESQQLIPKAWFSFLHHVYNEEFSKDLALPALPGNLVFNPTLGCSLTTAPVIESKPVNPVQKQNSRSGACSRHLLLLKLPQKQVEGRRLPWALISDPTSLFKSSGSPLCCGHKASS